MLASEAALVLAAAARFDGRRLDDPREAEAKAIAWASALDGLRVQDCLAAVDAHYRNSDEFMKPVHVRRLVSQLRAERLDRFDERDWTPPAELADDPVAYIAWIRESRRRVADGEEPPLLELPTRDMGALGIENTFRRVPER